MSNKTRKCIVCKKEYEYCNTCRKYNPLETWRRMYHSQECRTIFSVCSKFSTASISVAEARDMLKDIVIGDTTNFAPGVKQNLADIFADIAPTTPAPTVSNISNSTKQNVEAETDNNSSDLVIPTTRTKRRDKKKRNMINEDIVNDVFKNIGGTSYSKADETPILTDDTVGDLTNIF